MNKRRYDVILVDFDQSQRSKLLRALTEPHPYPALSRTDSAWVLVNAPAVICMCLELQQAVLLELLIELVGGSVDIRPSGNCEQQ